MSLDKSITNSAASAPTPESVVFSEAEDKSVRISKGSKEHVRPPDDFFETPSWVVAGILPHLPGGEIVDPCAGAGAIVAACIAAGRPAKGTEFDGERALRAKHSGLPISAGDGLALLAVAPAPLIVMNPPYSHAETWVRAAVKPGRTVAILLRLAFLEAACRVQLFQDVGMPDVQVLVHRPSFTGDGNTDGAAYAWMIWGPGRGGRIQHFVGAPPPKPKKRKERIK